MTIYEARMMLTLLHHEINDNLKPDRMHPVNEDSIKIMLDLFHSLDTQIHDQEVRKNG